MKKLLVTLLRCSVAVVALVVSTLAKLPDEIAPRLAKALTISEESAKHTINLLVVLVPLVVAFASPPLLRLVRRILHKHQAAEIDFTSRLWPDAPSNKGNPDNTLKKIPAHFQKRYTERLDAVKRQLTNSETVISSLQATVDDMLSQDFVAYATVADFQKGKPTENPEQQIPAMHRQLPRRHTLPPLAECSLIPSVGTVVAIVGEAGSGKSYALLDQLHNHLKANTDKLQKDGPQKVVLPIYMDLAAWKNLSLVKSGHELERWVFKFMMQEYGDGIKPEEAIWLLHDKSRPDVTVVLCLDGLDELREEDQQDCLKAIFDYADNRGHVVFTCRRQQMLGLIAPIIERQEEPKCWVFELVAFTTEAQCEKALKQLQVIGRYADAFVPQFRAARLYEGLHTPLLLNLYLKVMNNLPSFDLAVLRESFEQNGSAKILERLWAEYEGIQYLAHHEPNLTYQKHGHHFWRLKFWPMLRAGLYYIAVQAGSNSFRLDTIQPYIWLGQFLDEQPAATSAPVQAGLSPLQWYYLASRLVVGLLLAVAAGCLLAQPTSFLGDGLLIGALTAWFTLRRNAPASGATPSGQRWHWLRHWAAQHQYTLQVLGFVSLLMLTCGFYEGFKVPRRPDDMELWGTFSITQAIFGMTVGLLAGTVLGFRHTHTRDTDISLVERPAFRWLAALRSGLVLGWGGLGTVMGLIGAALILSFPNLTLGKWLTTALADWRLHLHQWLPIAAIWVNALTVFAVAFLVGGATASVLVALLSVLDRQQSIIQNETQPDNKTTARSVAGAAGYALLRGLLVAALVLLLLCGLVASTGGPYMGRLGRFALMATGAGLVTFLWFGGVEFIQHYTLRAQLALLQMLPLKFKGWLQAARKMDFVQEKAGSTIKFRHTTLSQYFQQVPGTVASTSKAPVLLLPPAAARAWEPLRRGLLPAMLVLLSLPLLRRFSPVWPTTSFWPHANVLDLRPNSAFKVLNDSTMESLHSGRVDVTVDGQVNVGDIIGNVGPQGAAYGFLGISLGHAYDRFPTANHGALFYRVHHASGPSEWQPLVPSVAAARWPVTLPEVVHSGERIQFAVNDAEWQNNTGRFALQVEIHSSKGK